MHPRPSLKVRRLQYLIGLDATNINIILESNKLLKTFFRFQLKKTQKSLENKKKRKGKYILSVF